MFAKYFLSVLKCSHLLLSVSNFSVICAESFTDSAISRQNGQVSNSAMKVLEPWDDGSDSVVDDHLGVQLDDPGTVSPFFSSFFLLMVIIC